MKETRTDTAVDDAGTLELVRTPAWEVKFKRGDDPGLFAHIVCCRDLDWRRSFCGFQDPDPVIMMDASNLCTMCIEAVGGLDGPLAHGQCPVDDQPCPPEEEIDKIIEERTFRP